MSYLINVKFTNSGDTTPLLASDYILADAENPSSVEEGGSATLKFKADGTYFLFKRRNGASYTGASGSWACSTDLTEATITLTNITSDVTVDIIAVVSIAPQLVSKPFLYQLAAPVDTRLVLTKSEMKAANDKYLPDMYFALCKDDGKFYIYHKNTDIINEETGKFILIDNAIYSIDGGEVMPLENSEA
jgi:hypothetical protein